MAGCRIMIVEDEKITAMDMQRTLSKMGYTVCGTASSGGEAIEQAGSLLPDVILMDITLQGDMDGVEAADRIKTQFEIPVIYLTAHADNGTVNRAKESEPYSYLLKPFRERELNIAIELALYKHKMEQERKNLTKKLQDALAQVRTLSGILPICSSCKKIRDDKGYWQRVEEYVSNYTDALFSHSICPDCARELYPGIDLYEDGDPDGKGRDG
jgi:two-component system, response regulator PdtaR